MPLVILKKLGIGDPKTTSIRLVMVDFSIKRPIGIPFYILVKVDKFILTTVFVLLDCDFDIDVPIILG